MMGAEVPSLSPTPFDDMVSTPLPQEAESRPCSQSPLTWACFLAVLPRGGLPPPLNVWASEHVRSDGEGRGTKAAAWGREGETDDVEQSTSISEDTRRGPLSETLGGDCTQHCAWVDEKWQTTVAHSPSPFLKAAHLDC